MDQISFPTDDPFWVLKYIWPWRFGIRDYQSVVGNGKVTKKPQYQWDDGAKSCLLFPSRKRASPSTHHWLLCSPCHSCPLYYCSMYFRASLHFQTRRLSVSFQWWALGWILTFSWISSLSSTLWIPPLGSRRCLDCTTPAEHFYFKVKASLSFAWGQDLGEDLGICLGHVPLECVCWAIISATSMLLPWGMFRDAEGA